MGFRDWARLGKLPEVFPLGNWGFLDFWREGESVVIVELELEPEWNGAMKHRSGRVGIVEVFEGGYVQVAGRSACSVV